MLYRGSGTAGSRGMPAGGRQFSSRSAGNQVTAAGQLSGWISPPDPREIPFLISGKSGAMQEAGRTAFCPPGRSPNDIPVCMYEGYSSFREKSTERSDGHTIRLAETRKESALRPPWKNCRTNVHTGCNSMPVRERREWLQVFPAMGSSPGAGIVQTGCVPGIPVHSSAPGSQGR